MRWVLIGQLGFRIYNDVIIMLIGKLIGGRDRDRDFCFVCGFGVIYIDCFIFI